MKKRFLLITVIMITGISFIFNTPQKFKTTRLPVFFKSSTYHPLIISEIQGRSYSLLVDSGSCTPLILKKSALNGLQSVSLNETATTINFKGTPYESEILTITDLKIGSFEAPIYTITKDHPNFEDALDVSGKSKPYCHGLIGWKFFENQCVLFDFPNHTIYLGKEFNDLVSDGLIKNDDYISTPFLIKNGVILVSAETELGKLMLVLDTGTSFCTIKKSKVDPEKLVQFHPKLPLFPNKILSIGSCDFGSWNFAALSMTDAMDADGIIGVDFFMEHPVCFDFKNNTVYIKKPSGILSTQSRRAKFYVKQFFLNHFSNLENIEDL